MHAENLRFQRAGVQVGRCLFLCYRQGLWPLIYTAKTNAMFDLFSVGGTAQALLKEVFLPWLNSFRFFKQNVEKFEVCHSMIRISRRGQ